MSTYTFPTNEKLGFLRDEEDWRPWLNMIQGRASSLEIWDKINPDHPSTFMEKPTDPQKPDPKDYEAKAGIEEPMLMSHLSKERLKSYKEDKQDYKDSIDDWKIRFHYYKEERQKKGSSNDHAHTNLGSLTLTGIEPPRRVNNFRVDFQPEEQCWGGR
ncbi:hypothetical protein E4U24_004924 [Claviceps purpurea]|nr:hypothetical protein E4U24_004924 [Claviceps purpurea]